MPTLQPYTLTFTGGLHIGTRGVNLEESGSHAPADTIFAAILDAWRRTGEDVAAFAAPFVGAAPDPPFLLTSGFPFAGGVRFYPMPVDLERIFTPETIQERGKDLKRIRYLSEGLFRRALTEARLDDDLFPDKVQDEPKTGVALQGGALWLTVDEIATLPEPLRRGPEQRHALRRLEVWKEDRVPRVTVNRSNSASTIYHSGRAVFGKECGLWLGVDWRNRDGRVQPGGPTWGDALNRTLAMLAEDGLGGERSAGYGAFKLGMGDAEITLPDPAPGGASWLLSRYHPRAEELPDALTAPAAAYKLVRVGGWLQTPGGAAQRRKQVTMIQEGSLVYPPRLPAGDVVDVRPDYEAAAFPHPVYRYGLALAAGPAEKEAQHA